MRIIPHPTGYATRIHHTQGQSLLAITIISLLILLPPAATSEVRGSHDHLGPRLKTYLPEASVRDDHNQNGSLGHSARISERELNQAIRWFAREHDLPQALIRAVIQAESGFDPLAVSPTGALGLMQLMPRTAASLNVRDPFNPVENIRGGAKHLRYLLDRFDGNLPLALAAYNAGEYRVKRNHYRIPAIQETQAYVEKVLSYYRTFKTGKHLSGGVKRMY
jgi:soluble lytic murein transglycosylase